MEARLITTDGRFIPIEPDNGEDFSLEELYNIVKCNVIQILPLRGSDKILVIDDEGKYRNEAVINDMATEHARKHHAIAPFDHIVGNAILCDSDMVK